MARHALVHFGLPPARNRDPVAAEICGGVSINPQVGKLRAGVDVVIATPGRLADPGSTPGTARAGGLVVVQFVADTRGTGSA